MNILAGWDYFFRTQPEANAQATAQRSTFAMFQEYPVNEVQGAGVMITQNGLTAGKYWNVIQPPQSDSVHSVITENILSGGTMAGTFYGSPLVPNPDSTSGMS